jgi:hypothetical protein
MVSLFSFSQFSCEKLKRVAPSEAVPGFSDGVTTRYYNFYIGAFFPKYLLLLINATCKNNAQPTSLYRTIPWQRWHCAPLVRNRAETQRGLEGLQQEEYRRVDGVSTRRFDEAATKKARAITSKTHLLSPGALSRCT